MTRNQQYNCNITIFSNKTVGRITLISVSLRTQMVARAFYWSTASQVGRFLVRFPMVSKSFRPQYGPGLNSSSNSSEFQEYFWLWVFKVRACNLSNLMCPCLCFEILKPQTPETLSACNVLVQKLLYIFRKFKLSYINSKLIIKESLCRISWIMTQALNTEVCIAWFNVQKWIEFKKFIT
jgi:hypothetical protein